MIVIMNMKKKKMMKLERYKYGFLFYLKYLKYNYKLYFK